VGRGGGGVGEPWGEILEHLLPFWLVAARLSGLFLFAPVFASGLLLGRVRVLLLVMLTVASYPMVAASAPEPPPLELGAMAVALFGELVLGLAIGMLATLPLVAVQVAGSVAGYKLGLALAQVFNPESDAQAEVIGQLLFFMALALYIEVGGLELSLLAVLRTFETLPPGTGWVGMAPASLLASLLDAAFVVGVRIAMPVLLMATLASVAMGVLMRTIPQINIMTIGFAIQIVLGVSVLAIAATAIGDVVVEHVLDSFDQIARWADTLDPAGVPYGR